MMVKPGCGAFRTSGRRYLCSCLCKVGGDWAWCWRRRCTGGEETECTHQAWCRRRGAQLSRKQKEGSDHPWSHRHRGSWPAWADKNEPRRRCVHRPVRMKQWRRCSAGENKTVAIEMERALVWLWTAVGGAGQRRRLWADGEEWGGNKGGKGTLVFYKLLYYHYNLNYISFFIKKFNGKKIWSLPLFKNFRKYLT